MYSVEVEYLGEIKSCQIKWLNKAIEWAENAVYDLGADWSCVYNPDMSIYCEYEA